MVTVGRDGAGDNHGVPTMMPAAMVVECNCAVAAMMQALAVLVDDLDVVVVSMVGPDNDIGLGCRSHCRQSDAKRQSAHGHCFHCNFSIALISPSLNNRCWSALVPVSGLDEDGWVDGQAITSSMAWTRLRLGHDTWETLVSAPSAAKADEMRQKCCHCRLQERGVAAISPRSGHGV